ncbi:M56 family metallopeptidase [Amycolatopsis sp.]|uniref:M56 family metallopeptidase n=1 Tax=Amycolatopsis sp. TaxID=37632 RepID=UPI002DFFFDB8|nr:M56 family metallopeptidase [Amycolatopsis sp.]
MFDHFAWSVVVAPLIVVLATWALGGRLRPDFAAWAFAWSAAAAAAASTLNLLVFALKALAEIPVVAALGGWSHDTVIADTVHVPWVSWLSLGWLVFIAGAVLIALRRHVRAMRAARREAGLLGAGQDVVILADDRIDAFAVPGRPGRIVVTSGMREVLDEPQYAALVAHERAHLDRNHHVLVWITNMAAVAHPVFRPVARKVEYLVERAADEAAADELGDRRGVAMAIGGAALAASASARSGGVAVRTPGTLMALGSAPGVVPHRVKALLKPGRRARWQVVVPVLLAASSVVWTGECVYDLLELLALARGPLG